MKCSSPSLSYTSARRCIASEASSRSSRAVPVSLASAARTRAAAAPSSSRFSPTRASPLACRAIAASAAASTCRSWPPSPRVSSARARVRMVVMSGTVSARSTYTCDRESSAALTSNEGFSVVAPISTMSPASTRGRNASCCALLNRWISSTNRMVRRSPRRRPSSAAAITARISLIPASTALKATNRDFVMAAITRASVVFPVPGGPQRMIDCRVSRSMA